MLTMKKVFHRTNEDIEARLDAIERRLAAFENRLPPEPPKSFAELIERAWRAPSLTAEEADLLQRARTRGLGWDDKITLELIARRASDKPVKPAAELIAEAAEMRNLTEAETIVIAGARKWFETMGDLPQDLRNELQRTICLRFPERAA